MRKRILSIAIVLTLAFSIVPVAAAAPLDTAEPWARERLVEAIAKGFVPTELQDNYKNVITRLEFCKLAVKWMEVTLGKTIEAVMAENGVSRNPNAFSDTSDPDILAAFALGILQGEVAPTPTAPGVFNPRGSFTRQQAAVMVTNTCKAIGADVSNPPQSDFAAMYLAYSWAVQGINFARANGIMGGVSTTPPYQFSPLTTFTRQESILLFNNIDIRTLPMGTGDKPVPPTQPTPPTGATIPGSGGQVQVKGETIYSFTPSQSGVWVFRTTDNENNYDYSDPFLELYDSRGELIAEGDDIYDWWETGLNALIFASLNAGETYTVNVTFLFMEYRGDSCTLTVSKAPSLQGSGDTRVNSLTSYVFTPNQTGLWRFSTSNNGNSDPQLRVFSKYDTVIWVEDFNDDGGDYLNSNLVVYLEAGLQYIVDASYYMDDIGSYTLTVTPPVIFNSNGGTVRINGTTGYTFTPNQSGTWEFRTSNCGVYDPYLIIYDSDGYLLDIDDDGGGGSNAFISLYLSAGMKVFIYAGEFEDGDETLLMCSYDLSVTRR